MNRRSERGRPVDPEQQAQRKNKLLDAALSLLEEKTYRSITIRELAERAEMQSAMVSYYFGSKEGLFLAAVVRQAEGQLLRFQEIRNSETPLRSFIKLAVANFADNPAIARFIADEIMSHESPLRDKFIGLMPKRMAIFLPGLIKSEQLSGRVRMDINPKWTAFSLMTMIIMPFIGAPVREGAWEISHDEIASEAWVDHLYQLFISGCGVPR